MPQHSVLIIGCGSLVTAALTIFKFPNFAFAILITGATVLGWIFIQIAMLRVLDPLQFVIGGIGIALLFLGYVQRRDNGSSRWIDRRER